MRRGLRIGGLVNCTENPNEPCADRVEAYYVIPVDDQPHIIYGSDLKNFERIESDPPHGYHEHAYHHMRPIDKELDPEEPWMQGVYRVPLDLMHGKNRPREHPARSAAAVAMAASMLTTATAAAVAIPRVLSAETVRTTMVTAGLMTKTPTAVLARESSRTTPPTP